MRKFVLLFVLLCISFAKAQAKREIEINFATASSTLSSEEAKKLNTFIKSIPKAQKNYRIKIIGHTDNVGDRKFNQSLSYNRAKEISASFLSNGFLQSKIAFSGKNYSQPIAENSDDNGKSKNRRAKIIVTEEITSISNLGGITLDEKIYRVDSGKRQTISYKSGTKINIPENAFVDKDGKNVTGNVDIKYVEYRDPIDFILGNISMEHGGGNFNSGGMYKILANQNGKQVYLKRGKNIDIDFALMDKLPDMNFYQFDTIKNKWTELSKLTPKANRDTTVVIEMKGEDPIWTSKRSPCFGDACATFYNTIAKGKELAASERSVYNYYVADKRYRDSLILSMKAYRVAREKTKDSLFMVKNKTRALQIAKLIQEYQTQITAQQAELDGIPAQIEKTKPYYVFEKTGEKNGGTTFKINLKAIYNIETVNFSRTDWTSNTPVNPEVFETKWDTCVIKKETASYVITLKKDGKTINIADLKFSNNKMTNERALIASMNNARKIQLKKINKLKNQKVILKRGIDDNIAYIEQLKNEKSGNRNKQKLDSISHRYDDPLKCFWDVSKEYMQPEELALSMDDWFKYFESNKSQMKKRYEGLTVSEACKDQMEKQQRVENAYKDGQTFIQSLSIPNLGIFNCDQVSRMQQPIYVDMNYQTKEGKSIKPLLIYLVDSRINGIICYYTPEHFAYNSTSENTLIAFDGAESYIVNSSDFKETVNGNKKAFTMKKIEKMENKKDLVALF